MRVISVLNLKGGVAKTFTAANVAYELYRRGYRVLLIDNDKQGNLSKALGKERGNMKEWAEWFYKSKEWAQTRDAYMVAQHYLCERCGEPAKIVHHKIWLTPKNIHEQSITLCWDNLEALCQDCHNKEHHAKNVRAKRYAFTADGELIPPIQKNIFRSR